MASIDDREVLVFGSDLMMGTKVRGEITKCGLLPRPARSLEQVSMAVRQGGLRAAVVDLNMQSADPFEAIEMIKQSSAELPIVAYFSHVDTELKSRAEGLGVSEVHPRSAMLGKLAGILGSTALAEG